MSNPLLVRPEKLDKIQKPIDESKYFQWKETVLDCASHKADWAEFTKPSAVWKARNEDNTRGLVDANKRGHLNSYTYIATFAPGSLVHDIINESTGNAYIDSRIRSMYQLKSTSRKPDPSTTQKVKLIKTFTTNFEQLNTRLC